MGLKEEGRKQVGVKALESSTQRNAMMAIVQETRGEERESERERMCVCVCVCV